MPLGRGGERRRNGREDRVHALAREPDRCDRDERDERDEQRVLEQVLTLLVAHERLGELDEFHLILPNERTAPASPIAALPSTRQRRPPPAGRLTRRCNAPT